MSKADEWYDEYSTTKRFSTQNTDERNKRYQRKSDEWYDKYSTTRRFESSIQYADDEEEKKENKPVIQPDTSVKPQQQTNTQTQTQTQVQAPTQTQTQITAPSLLEMQSEFGGFAQNSNKPVKADPLTFNKYGKGIDAAVANFSTTPEQQRKNQKTLQNVQKSLTSNNELLNKNLQEKSDAYSQKVNEIVKSNKDDDVKNNLAYEEQLKYEIENLQIALNRQNRQAMGLNPDKIYSDEQIKSAEITQRLDNLGGDSRYSLNKSEEQKTANDTAALLAEKSAQLKAVQELNAPYHLMDNPELSKDLQTMYANRKDPKAIETYGKNIKAAGYDPQKMLDWYTTQKNEEILKNPTAVALLNEIYAYNTRSTSEYDDEYDDSYIEKVMKEKSGYKAPHIVAMEARGKLANMGYDVDELYSYYSAKLNREGTEALLSPVKQFAKEHPVLGAATSIALTPLTSFGGIGAVARSVASGTPVDPNDPSMIFANTKSTIDSSAVSNTNAFDGLVYKTATTLGSMLVNQGISSAVGGPLGYALLSAAQAVTSSVQEDSQKGYSVEHIATNALVVGAMNFAFSMIGFEKVFGKKTVLEKGLKKAFRKAGFSEVGEELAEDGINLAAKNITNYVFNHETEIKADAQKYMSMGYSENEAYTKVWSEMGLQLLETGAISFITGSASNVVKNSPQYLDGVARLVGKQINIDLDSTAGRDAFDKLDINIGNTATDTENEQKTPLDSSVVSNDETVDTPKQNAVTGQNTSYANEFDNLYDEDVSEEFKQPAEEVDTTVDENGTVYFDFDDDTDFEAVNEELKEEYNAEETAGLTEKVEPYTSGNSSVDALINPNGRLDRKITINEQAQQRTIDIGQRFFGRKVKFVDDISNADGFFNRDTGEIVLSKTSSMKELTLFGHEFAHTLEGTDEYIALTDFLFGNSRYIKSELAKVNNDWDELVQKKIDDYQDSLGKTLTTSQAEYEIYADAIANELFTSYDTIERLATQNQSVFQKLKQWFVRTVFGGDTDRIYKNQSLAQRKTYALMLKAEKAAMNKASGEGVVTPTETVVFEPTQIKSATDNIGTFDKNNPDIRYSAKQSEVAQRITENFGYTETTANNIVKAARTLKKKTGSKADTDSLSYLIASAVKTKGKENSIEKDARLIATMIAESANGVNEEFVAENKPIMDYLKKKKISISEADISDLGDAFSYVQKRLFPIVTLAKEGGIPVDTFFQELSAEFPNVFDAETTTHPADQVRAIMDFIEDYRVGQYYQPYLVDNEAYLNLLEDVETLLGNDKMSDDEVLAELEKLVDKHGEIKNGVPKSIDGETKVRGTIATIMGTKAVVSDPSLQKRFAQNIIDGVYNRDVHRQGYESEKYLNSIKSSDDVAGKVESEYRRLSEKLRGYRYNDHDIVEACSLLPLLKDYLSTDDFLEFSELLGEVGTASGRNLRALRILNDLSPMQKLKVKELYVENYNKRRFGNEAEAVYSDNGMITDGSKPEQHKPGIAAMIYAKRAERHQKVKIPTILKENLKNAKTKQETDEAMNAIDQYIANKTQKNWWQRINAFRFLSMLSSPLTAIRNFVSNVSGAVTAKAKDVTASGLYKLGVARSHGAGNIRTVSVKTDKASRNAAFRIMREDNSVQLLYSGQNKQTGKKTISPEKPMKTSKVMKKAGEKVPVLGLILENRTEQPTPFKSKLFKSLASGQQKLLDDTPFKIARSLSVLSQAIHINTKLGNIKNIDDFLAVALNGDTAHLNKETIETYSRLYDEFCRAAAREGDEATLREENDLINKFIKFRNGDRVWNFFANVLTEGLAPFLKTPANATKRSVEYSPLGLVWNATADNWRVSKGDINRNTYINRLAKGITGTGMFALGVGLGAMGLISAGDDDEEDEAERKLLNGQEYSIKTANGSYTLDWMTPVSIPLFMGAKLFSIAQQMKEDKESGEEVDWAEALSLANVLLDAISSVSEPMFNQTMLEGINGAFEAIGREATFSDKSSAAAGALVKYCAENWLNQFMPSIGGAIARTIDDEVRTYYTDENAKTSDSMQDFLTSVRKKTPFASKKNAAKLDMWGQPIKSGNLSERLIENFISPGYYQEETKDEATLAIMEFAEDNNIPYSDIEKDIIKEVPNYFEDYMGEKYYFTAEEYEYYAGEIGKARKEAVEKYLIDGEDAEVGYRVTDIDTKNDSGKSYKNYVFEGNLANATNKKGWAPSEEDGEALFKYEYNDKNEKKATEKTAASDELFRKMLLKKVIDEVTYDASLEAMKTIAERRKD